MSTAPEEVREPGLPAVYAVRGADHDNIVFLREASWDDFQALSRMRGEHSAPRLSYLCDEADYRKLGVAEVWWWRKGRLTLMAWAVSTTPPCTTAACCPSLT